MPRSVNQLPKSKFLLRWWPKTQSGDMNAPAGIKAVSVRKLVDEAVKLGCISKKMQNARYGPGFELVTGAGR
jgi:hypothetical protein